MCVCGKPGMQGQKENVGKGGSQELHAENSSPSEGSGPHYWSLVVSRAVATTGADIQAAEKDSTEPTQFPRSDPLQGLGTKNGYMARVVQCGNGPPFHPPTNVLETLSFPI